MVDIAVPKTAEAADGGEAPSYILTEFMAGRLQRHRNTGGNKGLAGRKDNFDHSVLASFGEMGERDNRSPIWQSNQMDSFTRALQQRGSR